MFAEFVALLRKQSTSYMWPNQTGDERCSLEVNKNQPGLQSEEKVTPCFG